MDSKNIDYEGLKKRGFLKQKQDNYFVLRTRMESGVYKKEHLEKIGAIAEKYGRSFVHATVRQGLEVPFIKFEDIEKVENELKDAGVLVGTSGARLRTTSTCPGNNWCKMGLVDTFKFNERIEKGLDLECGLELPHKFKIAISGCPNSCARPQGSDIGVHGVIDASRADKRIGYTIYVGGNGGRNPRQAIKIDKVFTEEEALSLIRKIVEFYKVNAKPRQRLSLLIEEIGKDRFLSEIVV